MTPAKIALWKVAYSSLSSCIPTAFPFRFASLCFPLPEEPPTAVPASMGSPNGEVQGPSSPVMQIDARGDGEVEVNERTSLLAAANGVYQRTLSSDETLDGDESLGREIDPNDFDVLLSRTESYSTGLGIEPQSQENSMLRGPRRYSDGQAQRPGWGSRRRKSFASSTIGSVQEEPDAEVSSKSPFLAGVSVGRFWLIFSGSR